MTTQTLQTALMAGLNLVAPVAPTTTTLPILQTILVATRDGVLTLTATDLQTAIVHTLPAGTNGDGAWAVALPARLFTDWVKTLPGEMVELAPPDATLRLRAQCGAVAAELAGQDAADFPQLVDADAAEILVDDVPASDLARALRHVLYAAAADNQHPLLACARLRFYRDTLVLDAADGYRLAQYRLPLTSHRETTLLIPAVALKRVLHACTKHAAESVSIRLANPGAPTARAVFVIGATVMTTALDDSAYPDLDRVIPTHAVTTAILDRQELLTAVKRAAIFGRDSGQLLTLNVSPSAMWGCVLAARTDYGSDGQTELAGEITGDPMTIHANAHFLSEGLSALESARVQLALADPLKPLTFTSGTTFTYVVMPMQPGKA